MPLARRLAPLVPLGARLVGPLVYQPDQGVPSGLRRLSTRVNQALAERGYSAPWLWSPERCQAYWASRSSHSSPNHPATYVAKSPAIVDFLHGFWTPEVGPDSSILELGSNAGPNLDHLRKLGYSDLSGVEINPTAIEAMRKAFPDLAGTARISNGSLEGVVPTLAKDSATVVFTMAVMIHVHPSSHHLFSHVVRVARDYVCVVEAETVTLSYIFARNYRRVFEDLGCTQLKSVMINRESSPDLANYHGYVARLFSVPGRSRRPAAA